MYCEYLFEQILATYQVLINFTDILRLTDCRITAPPYLFYGAVILIFCGPADLQLCYKCCRHAIIIFILHDVLD